MEFDLRNRPIPWRAHPPTALDYKNVPVDLSDSRSDEALVDVTEWGIAAQEYYARTDGLNAPYDGRFATALEQVLCRRSVAERLRGRRGKPSLVPFLRDRLRKAAAAPCKRWNFGARLQLDRDHPT
jgi:hypothetical protein